MTLMRCVWTAATAVVFSIAWAPCSAFAQNSSESPPAAVHVAPLEVRTIQEGRTFVGDVVAYRRATIGSAVAGRVETMHVDEGDMVGLPEPQDDGSEDVKPEKGVPIAQLRIRTISIQVEAARAEVALREKELEELERGSRPEEKVQAEARRLAAEALLRYADARYERTRKLFEQGTSATQEEVDQTLSNKLAAEQELVAATAAYELVMAGPRQEQIEQARARLEAARENLRLQEDIRTKYTVRSPIPGYVVRKLTEEGEWLKEGDPVAEIVEIDPIEIQVPVPQDYVTRLRPGMEVTVRASTRSGQELIGTIHRIVPQGDPRSRTFPVLIRLPNPPHNGVHALMPGMLVQVVLGVGEPREALMAPKDALIWDEQQATIYVVATGASPDALPGFVPKRVKLGVVDGSQFEILGVLDGDMPQAGQQVVTIGNERLQPGQKLRILQVDSPRAAVGNSAAPEKQ